MPGRRCCVVWLSVGCVLGWVGSAMAAAPAPAAGGRPNVLLITVDTLRPDALGWVAGASSTPSIDELAAEGAAFAAAVSPVPLTLPAHASLMTGLVPPRHGVRDNGQILGSAPGLLAESFVTAGYRTAAFVSGYPLSSPFGLARGFGHYDDALPEGEGQWLERRAEDTTAATLAWFAGTSEPGSRKPWFVWVHYYDPHLPYDPPRAASGPRGAYDGEVQAVDRAIAHLLAGLEQDKAPRLTVFTADHGESLGEHGEASHGYFIYDSTILVPLIFHFPEVLEPASGGAVPSLIDVTPTILDLVGLPALTRIDGVSLAPTLAGGEQDLRPAYLESYQPWRSYGWSPLRGLRSPEWKWIAAPRPELYRLDDDPAEAVNVYADNVGRGRELHRVLREVLALEPVTSETVADPEVLAKLRSLGYLGAGATRVEPPSNLPDPKDRLALRELLTAGQAELDRGAMEPALARFDQVLAQEAGNPFALSRSGFALLRLRRLEPAIDRLRQAVTVDPEQAETRSLLAEALGYAGDLEGAAGEWMEVVRLQPTVARNWSNLGAVLGQAGKLTEAVAALGKAAELEPENPDRRIQLAFAEFSSGKGDAAARHLQDAARNLGETAFAHSGALGLILVELGRPDEARPWLAGAGAREPEYAEARFALARVEMAAGRVDAAREALAEALRAAPSLRARAQAEPLLQPVLPPG